MTLAVTALALTSCGNAGDGDTPKCVLCGTYNDIRGAIANQDGSQAQVLAGWVVVSIERTTSVARVGEVDQAGLFTLGHVNTGESQTLALFSADYILQSVLSMQSPSPNSIRQFFNLKTTELPKLINKGPVISFQNANGIEVRSDLASDQNGDGIPDGSVSIGAKGAALVGPFAGFSLAGGQPDSAQDLDVDGIKNEMDPDIDGDGIINIFDPDDNGNTTLDVFDSDANGDYKPDNEVGQEDTDSYFNIGVEYVSAQFALRPKDDGTGNETTLTFRTKVRDDITPTAVQIRGAPSLLNNAYFIGHDEAGTEIHTAFNRLLGDDGLSDDGAPQDRVFGKKIYLEQAKAPRAQEAVFFQLVFGTPEKPWYMEFPYVFPDLKPAGISAQYDANTKTVLLVGNPFGEYQTFKWIAHVYSEDGKTTIYNSGTALGTTRQLALPDNIFAAGSTYKFDVSAQVEDKIPGNPAYVIYSKRYPLQ